MTGNALAVSFTTYEELLDVFGGDAEFVDEVVTAFLNRCPILLEEIRTALDAGDAAAASLSAHSLQGSIGYFDTGAALAAARRIEGATAADLPHVSVLVTTLEQHVAELTRYLRDEFRQ